MKTLTVPVDDELVAVLDDVDWSAGHGVGRLPNGRFVAEVRRKARLSLFSSTSFPTEGAAEAWRELVADRLERLPMIVKPAPPGWRPQIKASSTKAKRSGKHGIQRDQRQVAA